MKMILDTPMTHEELKNYRKKAGLTQAELAKELDVARVTVSKWEQGVNEIPLSVSVAILAKNKTSVSIEALEAANTYANKKGVSLNEAISQLIIRGIGLSCLIALALAYYGIVQVGELRGSGDVFIASQMNTYEHLVKSGK